MVDFDCIAPIWIYKIAKMRSVFFIIILLLLVGCKNKNNQDAFANKILTDTILCDAAYQNIMLQQKEIYEFEHDSTQIVF